jgi:hypothetical protein
MRTGGRARRAAILVLTLWIVVVLGLISASMLEEVYLELKLARFQRDDFEAMALARAGLARAVADLRNDLMMDQTLGQNYDALTDVWARQDADKVGRDNEGVPMGHGAYWVWVDDEANKFNLNMVNPLLLKAALYELGVEETEVQRVAAAILDYLDPDDVAQSPGVGKEDEYYSAQTAKQSRTRWAPGQAFLYRCKNDRFSSVDELLSVYGVTRSLFYGLENDEDDPRSPIERLKGRSERARTREEREERVGLRDIFSTYSPGPININTADPAILRILFRAASTDPRTPNPAVEKLLAMRRSAGKAGKTGAEKPLRDIAEVMGAAGVPMDVVARLMTVAPLTVFSNQYHIWALGEVKGTQHLISASVVRSPETCDPNHLSPLFEQGLIHKRLIESFRRRHRDAREPIVQTTVRVVQWQEL